jgi:phytoene dehydrogenase-like protein
MNRQANDYEIIVLGSGLGGLLAGALLAKKRRSVLLLKEKGYQTSCQRDGYRFTPFSNFSETRLRPSLLQRIYRELGLSSLNGTLEGNIPVKRDPGKKRGQFPLQVILPGSRIDLFDDPSLLTGEWKREFPREMAQIEPFYDELGLLQHQLKDRKEEETFPFFPVDHRSFIRKRLSFSPRSKERMDKRLSCFSREFKEYLQLQLILWGNLFSDSFPISLAAYRLLHEERGEWVPSIELEKMVKRILDSFRASGGEIEEIESVKRVEKGWRKGFALSLEGDRRVFGCRSLLLNSPLHCFTDLLGKTGKSLSPWMKRIQPRYVLYPCFMGIRDKVVPVGMGDLLVSIRDLEKPYEEGNVLCLRLSPRGDEREAPEGRRALTVLSLAPFRSWTQLSLAHQESIMNHLRRLIPFLEQNLDFADFEWACQQTGQWSYPHFLYETTGEFDWREGVIPTRISRDLYSIGKENFPYLGLEGEVLSGLMATSQVLERLS